MRFKIWHPNLNHVVLFGLQVDIDILPSCYFNETILTKILKKSKVMVCKVFSAEDGDSCQVGFSGISESVNKDFLEML